MWTIFLQFFALRFFAVSLLFIYIKTRFSFFWRKKNASYARPPYKALSVEGLISFYLGFAPQAKKFWAFFLNALWRQAKLTKPPRGERVSIRESPWKFPSALRAVVVFPCTSNWGVSIRGLIDTPAYPRGIPLSGTAERKAESFLRKKRRNRPFSREKRVGLKTCFFWIKKQKNRKNNKKTWAFIVFL